MENKDPKDDNRHMSPEQYAKEIRNVYLAVGLVAFVFTIIVLGVTISWW